MSNKTAHSHSSGTTIWKLKKGLDRRFKSGHPWVYSNELQGSPKGVEPGSKVELQGPGGEFLAYGYGNPQSLIAFREITRAAEDADWDTPQKLTEKLKKQWQERVSLGLEASSFRWIYGEADFLPGLVIDRYRLRTAEVKGGEEVLVLQAHAAGADRLISKLIECLGVIRPQAAIVVRNDLTHRKLEGLKATDTVIAKTFLGLNETQAIELLKNAEIIVRDTGDGLVAFRTDLFEGQKTGFFLDQIDNIRLTAQILKKADLPKTVRILDLCCYVGQWSAQLTKFLREKGHSVEVTLVDASDKALAFAKKNVETERAQSVTVLKGNVLKDLGDLKSQSYDIVICDPPALITGRKDIPQGKHAYLKLNDEAIRLTAPRGFLVSCSCSQLLTDEDLVAAITKAAHRQNRVFRGITRGVQALDHPLRLEFTEGRYLKAWIGRVE